MKVGLSNSLGTALILSFLVLPLKVGAQDKGSSEDVPKINLNGYVKNLVTVAIPDWEGDWIFDNQIHNRLNFKWYLTKHLTFSLDARNRIFFGNSVQSNPNFERFITQSLDYFQLDWVAGKGRSYLMYSNVDRANISWHKSRYSITLGKQRINWGKSFVWNPNDVFNAYSFFDFDYEERRGTDALLIKYLTTPSSYLELAAEYVQTFDSLTMAAKYNFNHWENDFQLLSGKYQTDVFFGLGWAGQFKGVGVKGEASYFQPYKDEDAKKTLLADISIDYIWPSTLAVRLEILFNTNPADVLTLNILEPVTAKTLSFNIWSAFTSLSYEFTPLLVFNLNSIYYIDHNSFFFNPNLTFSLNDNTDLLIASQVFGGSTNSTLASLGSFLYTRFKWSF